MPGYIYIGRADNFFDPISNKLYTKLGLTHNPKNRVRNYNTDKHHPFYYRYLYKIINKPAEHVEDIFKKRTIHLKGKVVLNEPSAGTEIRFATPEELNEIFLKLCETYNIIYVKEDHKKVNKITIKKLEKIKINALIQPKITEIQKDWYNPYPHQVEALKKILERKPRGRLILPTGTGKTFIMIMAINKWLKDTVCRVLIVVPSLNLIQQTYKQIRSLLPQNLHLIINASDLVPFRDDSNILPKPDTDSLHGEINSYQKCLILSTYQSSDKLIGLDSTIDLCFFDEAHRTVGEADAKKASTLLDTNVKIMCRYSMTATQRVYKGKKENVSMNNEEQYGHVLYRLPFRQAIEEQLLTNYQLISTFCDEKGQTEYTHVVASIKYAFKQFDVQNMIIYSNSCQDAQNVRMILSDYLLKDEDTNDITVSYIAGETPMTDRNKMFKLFGIKGTRNIISSVNTITEGVDLPSANCVCFAQPRKSSINIIQVIGRILRKNAGKHMSYVLIPSCPGDYSKIRAVIRVLAEHDELFHLCLDKNKKKSLPVDKLISLLINGGGYAVDTAEIEYDKNAIDLVVKKIYTDVTGSGITNKWEAILELANSIKDKEQIFTKKGIDALIPQLKEKCPFSYNGNYPHQSLSHDLQELRDRGKLKFFPRGKKGEYLIL